MSSSILDNAAVKIDRFNDEGLHYNLVADAIHRMRDSVEDPFDKPFLRYLIAGLVAFDMARLMGAKPYDFETGGFASRLNSKLQKIRPLLEPLIRISLTKIDLPQQSGAIMTAYQELSANGTSALHANQAKHFHVGATKILHFLNPELFIIIDSNASRAFRTAWKLPFRGTTQPGYSANLYLECMKRVQMDISTYGLERFRALDPDVPVTRIYDKLTFVTGSKL